MKATLRIALPARSSPVGASSAAATERVSERAVSARAPSIVASTTTTGSEKWLTLSASAPNTAASPQ